MKTTRVLAGPAPATIDYCVCEDLPTLVWMAQLAAIELHPSLSLGRKHERPTVLAFDLDPGPPADVVDCCRVALRLRGLLGHFEVECFAKTSGSKGMQIYVPLNTATSYEETRPFAQAIAQLLAKADRPTGDRLEDGQKVDAQRQGLHRLVPEQRAQNDDRRLLAAGARTAHGLHPDQPGRRSTSAPRASDADVARLRGGRRPEADRRATATSSRRCSS